VSSPDPSGQATAQGDLSLAANVRVIGWPPRSARGICASPPRHARDRHTPAPAAPAAGASCC